MAIAGLLGAVVAVTFGVLFAGRANGSGLDDQLAAVLELPPSSPGYAVSQIVQKQADPIPAVALVLMLAAACLRFGKRRLAVLAIAGPAAADAIVILMKHIVGRTIHHAGLSYPSTHSAQTTGLAIVAAFLAIDLLDLQGGAGAIMVLGAATVSALVMGWALVADGVHYATDTFAGFCIAVAIVPLAAWCTDLIGDRIGVCRPAGPFA
jgi:undecaprenyl-diphosphatase